MRAGNINRFVVGLVPNMILAILYQKSTITTNAFIFTFQSKKMRTPTSSLSQFHKVYMNSAGYDQEDYLAKRATFEPTQTSEKIETSTPWPAYYCSPDLNRTLDANLWKDSDNNNAEKTLNELLQSSKSRFVPVWKGQNLISSLNNNIGEQKDKDESNLISPTAPLSTQATSIIKTEAIFLSYDTNLIEPLLSHPDSILFHIGQEDGLYFFGLDISYFQVEPIRLFQKGSKKNISFQQLRSIGGTLTKDTDANILATARGYGVWHRSMLYCSKCGSRTQSSMIDSDMTNTNDGLDSSLSEEKFITTPIIAQKLGTGRKCTNPSCKASYYPRIDPSMIAMIFSTPAKEHVLLGRKSVWPNGRYSVLAGFAEIGESMEECVVREVHEESGVILDRSSLQFFASQPWPFPRSLMVGFTAIASASADRNTNNELPKIKIDEKEMEDVRWFSKDEVKYALTGDKEENEEKKNWETRNQISNLSIPGRASLAYKMLSSWIQID